MSEDNPRRWLNHTVVGTGLTSALGDFSHSLLILAATQLLTSSMRVIQAAQVVGLLYGSQYYLGRHERGYCFPDLVKFNIRSDR
jgi:hypothetical protein